MSRKKTPGISRERLRVFVAVLEETTPRGEERLLKVLRYVLGEVSPTELGEFDPRLVAPARAAEARR
jgi:hypothetical protein